MSAAIQAESLFRDALEPTPCRCDRPRLQLDDDGSLGCSKCGRDMRFPRVEALAEALERAKHDRRLGRR